MTRRKGGFSLDQAIERSGHLRVDRILLWCPECEMRYVADRVDTDYPEATLLEMRCPECVGGDFDLSTYYDAKGNEVLYDPADIPKRRKTLASQGLKPNDLDAVRKKEKAK